MTAPQGGNIETQHHQIERAPTSPASDVAGPRSRVLALPGVAGPIAVALAFGALAVAAAQLRSAPGQVLAASGVGVVTTLGLGAAVGIVS